MPVEDGFSVLSNRERNASTSVSILTRVATVQFKHRRLRLHTVGLAQALTII